MAATAPDYRTSAPAQRETLRPVPSHLGRDHSRHVENFPIAPSRAIATVKWSTARKNFCYLTLRDGRDVFLHRDDFAPEWPPKYRDAVEFDLVETGHKTCPLRAKDARTAGPR
jgi:cold shock CspA family protein